MLKIIILKNIKRNVKINGEKFLVSQDVKEQTLKIIDIQTNKPIYTYAITDGKVTLKYVKDKHQLIFQIFKKAKTPNYILYA